jgi:hypothetical protein
MQTQFFLGISFQSFLIISTLEIHEQHKTIESYKAKNANFLTWNGACKGKRSRNLQIRKRGHRASSLSRVWIWIQWLFCGKVTILSTILVHWINQANNPLLILINELLSVIINIKNWSLLTKKNKIDHYQKQKA